jgi:hypothetical protein
MTVLILIPPTLRRPATRSRDATRIRDGAAIVKAPATSRRIDARRETRRETRRAGQAGRADRSEGTHAENLGYTHCWVTDSPMLRLAPAVANGIATIDRLAPGRGFIGLGTGHTAGRMLGQKPMRLGPFREYIRVVRALLDGEQVDFMLYPPLDRQHRVIEDFADRVMTRL